MNGRMISMLFGWMLLVASTDALALRCVSASDGSAIVADTISTNIPVPADAVDGTVIWESTPRTVSVTCSHDWSMIFTEGVYLYVNPTNSGAAAGTTVGIRWGGQLYTQMNGRIALGEMIPQGMDQTTTFSFSFTVVVMKMGMSPTGGLSTFNSFRVFQIDGEGGLNATPGYNINYVLDGTIRFIGCMSRLGFFPSNVIDFGRIMSVGTAGEVAVERDFVITATRECTSPYALNLAFVPTTSTPGGVVSGSSMYVLNNDVGISIVDSAMESAVPLDGNYTAFVDLMNVTSASKAYRARLTRQTSALGVGAFSATMLITVEYY